MKYRTGTVLALIFTMLTTACGPTIRQWNMKEGQENVNKLEAEKGTAATPKTVSKLDAIHVRLYVPKDMACITLAPTSEDRAAGHKIGVCPLKPIVGQNPAAEARAMWDAETGAKSRAKLALVFLEIGPMVKSELERALAMYYQKVTVTLVNESESGDAVRALSVTVYPIFGGKDAVAVVGNNLVRGEGAAGQKIAGKHAVWFFPTMLMSIPLFMWAPAMGVARVHDVVGAKAVAASIRAATNQLAEEIARNDAGAAAVGEDAVTSGASAPEADAPISPSTPESTAVPVPSAASAQAVVPLSRPTEAVPDSPPPETAAVEQPSGTSATAQPTASPAPEGKIWSIVYNGKTMGPFSTAEIQQMIQTGVVTSDTHIWKEGMTSWLKCKEVEPFASSLRVR